MIFLYITCKDEEEAEHISTHLLEKKLCACTNYYPIKSMYWWKGKIEKEDEYVLIVKTMEEHVSKIEKEVKEIHSYETPCVLQIDVKGGNKIYETWMKESIA
mgnify:CR=1 FL=1